MGNNHAIDEYFKEQAKDICIEELEKANGILQHNMDLINKIANLNAHDFPEHKGLLTGIIVLSKWEPVEIVSYVSNAWGFYRLSTN